MLYADIIINCIITHHIIMRHVYLMCVSVAW